MPTQCKIPDALTATQGHQFFLLSPEAVRLTLLHKKQHFAINRKKYIS
jgi:hypothetical protein